jgi:hypothetical protein
VNSAAHPTHWHNDDILRVDFTSASGVSQGGVSTGDGGFMFMIEKDAAQYINESAHAVVIGLRLEPSTGGCHCSPVNITGSYTPVLSLGKPSTGERVRYKVQLVDGVEVYFSGDLTAKQGCSEIRIKLRRFLWFRWLELEGAKAIASYS